MERSGKTVLLVSLGFISGVSVCWALNEYRRRRHKRKQSTFQFPRADYIEEERAKNYSLFTVDRRKIHLVCTAEEWEDVLPLLQEEIGVFKAIGLDCEWANVREHVPRPVSLLQLATSSGLCVLIRLNLLNPVPDSLRAILTDKGILKLGVACYDDGQKLHQDHGLCLRGCVDLRYITLRSKSFKNAGFSGLKGLCESVLQKTLDKDYHVRCSDWEADTLSQRQIQYAAADALVAIRIFTALLEDRAKITTDGAASTSQDNGKTIEPLEIWKRALSSCQGIVDVNFSSKGQGKNKSKDEKSGSGAGSTRCPSSGSKGISNGYIARTTPLYHNCQLLAPDNQLLCTCDLKKALWYVDKGLGEKVSNDPLTVKLKFEPSGRPLSERNYYLTSKENICVVCGKEESFIRKNIVPREYRKFFPSVMKDHKSHDVVLLCTGCHQQCSVQDDQLKQQLALKCNAPFSSGNTAKYSDDKNLTKVRSAAKALIMNGDKIPEERKNQLEQVLYEFYGVEELDEELLEEAVNMDTKVENNGFVSHGKKVVLYTMKNEGLIAFEKMWRQHFLENMTPKFLPELWSVDHSHDRLAMMENNLKRATKIITREKVFHTAAELAAEGTS